MIRRGTAVLAVTLAALLPGRAAAQYFPQQPYNPQYGVYSPQYQPNLSPYLNILRGNPAVNYYGATRGSIPSIQQNMINNQFGSALFDMQRRQTVGMLTPSEEIALLPGTGHPTAFGYYGPYYNLNPGQRIQPRVAPQQQQSGTGSRRTTKQ